MPKLNTRIHLKMLEESKRYSFPQRIINSLKKKYFRKYIYGLEWGNPETIEPLRYIKKQFILPYVNEQSTGLEIGPGGGRWTQYLLKFDRLYLVDYHQELLNELKSNFNQSNFIWIKNNGTDFPNIPKNSIDFLFSFGVFVHLDLELIEEYLNNIFLIAKSNSNLVIQYSDKDKILGQKNPGFSDNNPEKMIRMIKKVGFKILEEDRTSLWHSSIVRFTKI